MALDAARFLVDRDDALRLASVAAARLPSAEQSSLLRDDRPEVRPASVSLDLFLASKLTRSFFAGLSARAAGDMPEARPDGWVISCLLNP